MSLRRRRRRATRGTCRRGVVHGWDKASRTASESQGPGLPGIQVPCVHGVLRSGGPVVQAQQHSALEVRWLWVAEGNLLHCSAVPEK